MIDLKAFKHSDLLLRLSGVCVSVLCAYIAVYMYVYIYIYLCMYVYIYIYVDISQRTRPKWVVPDRLWRFSHKCEHPKSNTYDFCLPLVLSVPHIYIYIHTPLFMYLLFDSFTYSCIYLHSCKFYIYLCIWYFMCVFIHSSIYKSKNIYIYKYNIFI